MFWGLDGVNKVYHNCCEKFEFPQILDSYHEWQCNLSKASSSLGESQEVRQFSDSMHVLGAVSRWLQAHQAVLKPMPYEDLV